jgi:hypothetical protein
MSDAAQALALPGDVRDELRVLHARREQALQQHSNMIAAERRGAALLADAESELAEIEQQAAVDAAMAAERLAADIAAGERGSLPGRPPGWLQRREIAQDRVSAARAAHRQLESGVAAAARAAIQAAADQQGAIARLLRERGETLAAEIEAAERLALSLRDELTALGRVHLVTDGPGRPVLIRLGMKAVRVLNSRPVNDPDRQKPGGIDLLAPQAARWRDAAAALMSDPDAPLPGMED